MPKVGFVKFQEIALSQGASNSPTDYLTRNVAVHGRKRHDRGERGADQHKYVLTTTLPGRTSSLMSLRNTYTNRAS